LRKHRAQLNGPFAILKSLKTMLVHSAMSRGTDAIGLRKYDLGLPSHLEAVTTITVRKRPDSITQIFLKPQWIKL
jgi:hypothetical protein